LSNFIYYKLLEACRESGCPVCRVEQEIVRRYIENQFYENVNSPKWRDRLRASLGFCHEHAWLAVDRRLGDALGFSIIYRDILNSVLTRLEEDGSAAHSSRHWTSLLRQVPEQARTLMQRLLNAITPAKRCPVCEHRDEMTRMILSVMVDGLNEQELIDALEASDGLCLPHLQKSLEQVRDVSACELLLGVQRGKLETLRAELMEFIRKNDYQVAQEGFGREGDAWLRAVALIVGTRKAQ
jgi:hypothetical protein